MTMSTNMSLSHINLLTPWLGLMTSPNHTSQQTCNKEEDAIHDTKRKTSFKHRACFIHFDTNTIDICITKWAEIDIVPRVCGNRSAIGVGDEAELIDTGDEGPDETEIDEGDEEGVIAGTVVGEEGCDGPGASKD